MTIDQMTTHCLLVKIQRAFLRAFLANKFGSAMNFLYLCIVNEKQRNLRPN